MRGILQTITGLLGSKGEALQSLLLSCFKLLGEANIMRLIAERLVFTLACHVLLLMGVALIAFHIHAGFGWLIVAALILVLYPLGFFYHIHKRACQTWFAYAKITNKTTTVEDAEKAVSSQKWALRLFAVIEFFIARANNSRTENGGLFDWLVSLMTAALEGLFEIAESYLLPALVIEQVTVKQAAEKLRQLRGNIPQTLAGTFGIDILGGAVSALIFILYFVILLIGVGISFLDYHHQLTLISNGFEAHVTMAVGYPAFVSLVLVVFIHKAIKVLSSSLQATYFAVFYTTLNRPNEIAEDQKPQVMHFLTQGPLASASATL